MRQIGVVGATGSLGRQIVSQLEAIGAGVTAVDPRGADDPSVGARSSRPRGRTNGLASLLATLQALVVAAPLPDVAVHRTAVRSGCHVVDVTVSTELNQALLTLDVEAVAADRSVIAMAGLTPGLSGLLGSDVLGAFAPAATTVCVALLQSTTGTAGVHGIREMLDLLTRPDAGYRLRPVASAAGKIRSVRLFGLRNAEPNISGLHQRLELVTGFDRVQAHAQLRMLTFLRNLAPGMYTKMRDGIAERKAHSPGHNETTRLSAVAVDDAGTPVGGRLLTLSSDYGATAAVAAAITIAAATRQVPPGAGHLRHFIELDRLLASQPLPSVIRDDSGPIRPMLPTSTGGATTLADRGDR